jgi:hypothetical protein
LADLIVALATVDKIVAEESLQATKNPPFATGERGWPATAIVMK